MSASLGQTAGLLSAGRFGEAALFRSCWGGNWADGIKTIGPAGKKILKHTNFIHELQLTFRVI